MCCRIFFGFIYLIYACTITCLWPHFRRYELRYDTLTWMCCHNSFAYIIEASIVMVEEVNHVLIICKLPPLSFSVHILWRNMKFNLHVCVISCLKHSKDSDWKSSGDWHVDTFFIFLQVDHNFNLDEYWFHLEFVVLWQWLVLTWNSD